MPAIWIVLNRFELADTLFDPPWLMIVDVFEHVNRLSFTAEGEWAALAGLEATCGPDGLPGIALAPAALVLPSCRPGALIGKFGGSSANLDDPPAAAAGSPSAPPSAFAIGTRCVMPLPADARGPLFIGFNGRSRPLQVTQLKLVVAATTI